jgi:hypothetical protein
LTGVEARPDLLTVGRVTDVTTWPVGDRVHVVRDRREVFVLGERAGRVWRSLVPGRPLPAVLDAARSAAAAQGPPGGAFLARFLRFGLVRLVAADGSPVTATLPLGAPPGPVTPPPGTARPVMTVHGAVASGDDAIDLVPMPADRFSAAALTLVWSNVLVENVREDLTGAVHHRQWRVAELAARRIVQVTLRGLLSAHGVHPLPPDPDLVRRLDLLPVPTGEVRRLAEELETAAITTPEQAATVQTGLYAFVAAVRAMIGAGAFPSSFSSPEAWRATLDLGYDWLRLGAYLDAALPIDEARDLLSSGGAQPHPRR